LVVQYITIDVIGAGGIYFKTATSRFICDEDAYFKELVRYIHLNPLRAKLVKSLTKLDRYRWSGHGAIMGKVKCDWQHRDYVLRWFGKKEAVPIEEIKGGSRRRKASRVRTRIAIGFQIDQ